MASGKLGSAALSATTTTTIYTVPAGNISTFNINVLNTGTSATTVRVAVSSNATPTMSDYIEFDYSLAANGVLERTAVIATAGEVVVGYAGAANITIRVHGVEETV